MSQEFKVGQIVYIEHEGGQEVSAGGVPTRVQEANRIVDKSQDVHQRFPEKRDQETVYGLTSGDAERPCS